MPASVAPPARPAPPATSVWPGLARRGLRTQGVCMLVALVIWLAAPGARGGLATAWIYSAAIGTSSWLLIDGGRILLARWVHRHRPQAPRPLWPGRFGMAAVILAGSAGGYTLGSALGDALTGFHTTSLLLNRSAVAITLISAVAASAYMVALERLRQQQAEAEAARRVAAESQLMLLQSQLEPHMLFNTLANLRALIALDPPRAQAMLDRLVAYLRATLGASRVGQHALSREFERLADYLALMGLRMGERLQVRLDLPEALRGLTVPALLLQPLVENSIRHGLEPKLEGGRLELQARQVDGQLRLRVRDTGVGLDAARIAAPAAPAGDGTAASHYGTRHVAERLAALYGDAARFQLRAADDAEGGTLAEITLPLAAGTATST